MVSRRTVLLIGALLVVGTARVGLAGPRSAAPFEVNVSADPAFGGSEPWVSANPLRPNNLVEGFTRSAPMYGGAAAQTPEQLAETHPSGYGGAFSLVGQCAFGVSEDGGQTWRKGSLPLSSLSEGPYTVCGDTMTTVDSDGVFYGTGLVLTPCVCTIEVRVTTSYDGGKTWGIPGQATPYTKAFAPGQWVANVVQGAPLEQVFPQNPDREFIHPDPTNNWVYVHNVYKSDPKPSDTSPIGVDPTQQGRSWINVSTDKAKSWAEPYPLDTPEYPATGVQGSVGIAPAFGVVAASYTIASVGGKPCTCGIFETIKYDPAKKQWTTTARHVTPFTGRRVVADPTSPGTYTVASATSTQLQTHVTRDFGKTWSGPTTVVSLPAASGDTIFQPWLSYAPQGNTVGAVWRVSRSPNNYIDVYTALSRDRGKSFAAPVRMNTVTSPPTGAGRVNLLGSDGVAPGYLFDDTTSIWLDRNHINIAYATALSGNTDAWFGRLRY